MDNKDNTQVFSLEEIMQEFATGENPPPAPVPEGEDQVPAAGDTIRLDALTAELLSHTSAAEEAEESEEADEETDVKIFSFSSHCKEEQTEEADIPEETEESPSGEEEPEASEEEAPEAEAAPAPTNTYHLEAEDIPAPRAIPFRSNLSELKRQLVAGPEKRYYDLSEIGLGRVQIAIFLNFLVVLLCAGGTALYALGMVMETRMRLLVFSQILAMMVSALLGCYVLMDGITDLFTGKFSLNSMLFLTLAACSADAVFCLRELRVPCCAAFCLEMTMALWNRSLRRGTEMGQMDTLRKATRLDALVKVPGYFGDNSGLVRTKGRLEDFMENYGKRSGPETVMTIYSLVSILACTGIAVLAGLRHNLSLAIQVFATSMLVAVPAGAFIAHSRPAAILQRRLHMVGTVICGWQGVKTLCGKASFPINDRELFPLGATKLNGVKFLEDWDPEEIIVYAASLMAINGGGLEPVFTQLLKSRGGQFVTVEQPELLASGVGGQILGQQVLLGTRELMQQNQVAIPDSAAVSQAVYCAVDGRLAAVFAINYSRTKAAAGGLVTLTSSRKIRPLILCRDFLIDQELLRSKFGIRTKRYDFPDRADRDTLAELTPGEDLPCAALLTQLNLSASAYAATGAKALRTTGRVGTAISMLASIVGLLVMAALAYLGDMALLSPFHILLYQLVWLVPGLLVTEWTRTV